jgi:hypothetical protein
MYPWISPAGSFQIVRYREQMENSEKVWQQRLAQARQEMEVGFPFFTSHSKMFLQFCFQDVQRKEKQQEEEERNQPHLSNLNEDPALVGKIKHVLKSGSTPLNPSLLCILMYLLRFLHRQSQYRER